MEAGVTAEDTAVGVGVTVASHLPLAHDPSLDLISTSSQGSTSDVGEDPPGGIHDGVTVTNHSNHSNVMHPSPPATTNPSPGSAIPTRRSNRLQQHNAPVPKPQTPRGGSVESLEIAASELMETVRRALLAPEGAGI